MTENRRSRPLVVYGAVFVVAALLTAGVMVLYTSISTHKQEAAQSPVRIVAVEPGEIDPAVWGQNFPLEYDSFQRTQENYGRTPYGGSEPYSKLERYPVLKTLWAGYAFSKDYDEERGHYYGNVDQKNTERVKIKKQPGACLNCHAAEAPGLIAELGWEAFNATPYDELKDRTHLGTSCSDCHDPETMALVITRPAFTNAMAERGIDVATASRQEMRTYVCAQCHVEYYFKGDGKVLTFPWSKGLSIDAIEEHYDTYGFKDWDHETAGSPMIKIQHPEYELWSSGIHARSGVACADCHMPYVREGSVKVSDHWLRSPLVHVNESCQTCHKWSEEELTKRVVDIQDKTAGLLTRAEDALSAAIAAIASAKAAGATDDELAAARQLHRSAQLRWDFVKSENSTGFHSPQEAARILAESVDLARQAELAVWKLGGAPPEAASRPASSTVPTTAATPVPDATATPRAW